MNTLASWLLPGVVLWVSLGSYDLRFLGDLGGDEGGMGAFVNAYEGGGVGSFGVRRNLQTNVRCDLKSWLFYSPPVAYCTSSSRLVRWMVVLLFVSVCIFLVLSVLVRCVFSYAVRTCVDFLQGLDRNLLLWYLELVA